MEPAKAQKARPAKVIAITGGLGAGKSTVAAALREQGYPVVDTDLLAREAVAPGEPALAALVADFGPAILTPTGCLNRARLRQIILDDHAARRTVDGILHPRIMALLKSRLKALAQSGHDLVFVEVPLLFEAGWQNEFNGVVAVTAPHELCIERIVSRNRIPRAVAERWVKAQMPQEAKAARADFVLVNDGDESALKDQVRGLVTALGAR